MTFTIQQKKKIFIIVDSTSVKEIKKVLTTSKSKDSFSLLLTDVLMKQYIKLVAIVTRIDVLSYTSDLKCTKKREALSWYDIVWNLRA